MSNTLRLRLTLWYVAVLTLTLGASSFFVYRELARNYYERLEARLETALEVMASSLGHEIDEHGGKQAGEESFRFVLRTIHPLTFQELEMGVMEGDQLLARKPLAGARSLTTENLAEAVRRTAAGAAVWSAGGYRLMAVRRTLAGNAYVLVAGGSEQRAEAEVWALQRAFLFGLPVPFLLAAAGGWWLVRKSLAPVGAMSETADAISAESLGKRLEIANPEDELGRLGRSFNRLLERLEESFAVQRRFMSDASHELRTPVSVAKTAAEVTLERGERSVSEYREALGVIAGQLQRMGRLVEDMFLLARVDSGAALVRREECYLDEIVTECVAAARVLAGKKAIAIEGGPWEELRMEGDETRLKQAVMILLDNAVKYSPAGKRVQVALERNGTKAFVEVADEGPGIPEGERERIFERFYRIDVARGHEGGGEGGAGLGLPIARWIAEQHGGSLRLVDQTGPESRFRFEVALS